MLEQSKTKTAIIYARVSTDEQADTGTSINNQVRQGLEYAQANNLHVPEGYIFREDYPGTTLERPELNKVRELFRTGQADSLIVYKPNRLDRSLWGTNLLILLGELKQLGIEHHDVQLNRQIDLNNSSEVLVYGSIGGWKAGEDHKENIIKMWEGRIGRTQDGYVMVHGRPPYGYNDIDTGKGHLLKINEDEKKIVRLIFQWYVFGDESGSPLSLGGIAKKLDEMGIPAPAGQWGPSTVTRIVKSETYCGVWHYRKRQRRTRTNYHIDMIPEPVEVPAIVSRELWEAAQERLGHNKQQAKRNRKPGRYLAGGLVECGECGYKLRGVTKSAFGRRYTIPYYIHSSNARKMDTNPESRKGYRADKVDSRLWAWIEETATDQQKLLDGAREYRTEQQTAQEPILRELELTEGLYQDKTQELDEELVNLGVLTSKRAKARKAADIELIENQLDSLESKREQLQARLDVETLSDEQAMTISRLTRQAVADLKTLEAQADNPELALKIFEAKRELIEMLGIQITLFRENGREMMRVTAKVAAKPITLPLDNCTSRSANVNRQWFTITVTLEL